MNTDRQCNKEGVACQHLGWFVFFVTFPIYSRFVGKKRISWPNGAYVTSAFQKGCISPGVQIVQANTIYSLILILIHYSQPFYLSQQQRFFTRQLTRLHVLTLTHAICSLDPFFFYKSVAMRKQSLGYLYWTAFWHCFWHPTRSHCENSSYLGNKHTTIRAS